MKFYASFNETPLIGRNLVGLSKERIEQKSMFPQWIFRCIQNKVFNSSGLSLPYVCVYTYTTSLVVFLNELNQFLEKKIQNNDFHGVAGLIKNDPNINEHNIEKKN